MAAASLMQVPLNNVERIEIIRGASSVLYGDAAIGGVINIITRRGAGAPQLNIAGTAGSNSFHDEKIGVSGSAGKLSYALNGQNQFSWGYRDRSKFAFSGAGFNVGYDASAYLGLALDGSFSKTSFAMPGGLTKSQMEQNPRQIQTGHENDDASEDYANLHGKIEAVLGKLGRLDTDVYYGNKMIKSNFESYWPPDQFNSYNIRTMGIAPKYILEQTIAGHDNKLIAGVDYYLETMALDKYAHKERTTKTHLVNFDRNTLGFYIRDDFHVLPVLILAGGYRHERAQFQGTSTTLSPYSTDFDAGKIHQADAWETSLTYLVGHRSKIYAKYANVYRYPFIDEQASFYSSGPFNTFNVNIEREKGKSYEIGAVASPLENLKIGLTLYRIDMEDEISADPVTWELKNLDKTRRIGGEFNLHYVQKGYFSFNGNVTYRKAVFDQGDNNGREIPLVPNLMANATLEINLPYNFFLTPKCHYTGSAFLANDYDNNGEKLESYLRWDLYLYWRSEIKGKKIIVFAGAENLTDEKYSTYGIDMSPWGSNLYYPADGVTIKGGVSLTF